MKQKKQKVTRIEVQGLTPEEIAALTLTPEEIAALEVHDLPEVDVK